MYAVTFSCHFFFFFLNLKNTRSWLYICHEKVWSAFITLYHQDPHCSDMTLCGWQDVKVHELTNPRCSDVTLFGWQDVKVHELTNPHYSDVTLCGWQDVKVHELTNPRCSEVTLCGWQDVKVHELTDPHCSDMTLYCGQDLQIQELTHAVLMWPCAGPSNPRTKWGDPVWLMRC